MRAAKVQASLRIPQRFKSKPPLGQKRKLFITQSTIYRVIGYFWMSNFYFAVATDIQFDLAFEAPD